jgi:hypothetical protein
MILTMPLMFESHPLRKGILMSDTGIYTWIQGPVNMELALKAALLKFESD